MSNRTKINDDNLRDAGLKAKEGMERVMKGIHDCLHRENNERATCLHDTNTRCGLFLGVRYCDVVQKIKAQSCKI